MTRVFDVIFKRLALFLGHQHCYLCHQSSAELCCLYCQEAMLAKPSSTLFLSEHNTHLTRVNLLNTPSIVKHLATPAYSTLIALGHYKWPLDKMILDLKFAQKVYCADLLAAWFAKRVHALCLESIEALVPIPLSNLRYISRQYNQAALIADALSSYYDIPVVHLLYRNRQTKAQAQLSPQDREHNLRGAFSCVQVPYKHIAIVDDVVTTGTTVNQACLALVAKQADIQISVIAMAISLKEDST